MELRQLRYFLTLAEELHFGRAAAREHIVQSALSQQLQRLERELGVRLLERSTHHVGLTTAGAAFLVEARQILAQVERAAQTAPSAAASSARLRVGIVDAGYDSMPLILHEVQARYPDLVIHQVEVSVPEQYQQLLDGRLDVGIGRATLAPAGVASRLFRQDPLGVLVPDGHRFTALDGVPAATLTQEPLLLAEDAQAPEFNQFVAKCARSAGFTPVVYEGTVESIRAAALVAAGRCLYCVPSSCISALPRTIWAAADGSSSGAPGERFCRLAAAQLLLLRAQRRAWEKRMGELLLGGRRPRPGATPKEQDPGKAFPGGETYLSMPGLGDRLAARVAGEIGEHIEQFTSPNALQCYAGRAPVTRRSGRSEFTIARRLAYNRYLGEAVQQWAFCSLTRSTWAREFYDAKITKGTTTTPPCANSPTAGWRSSGAACASASSTTKTSMQPTDAVRSHPQ